MSKGNSRKLKIMGEESHKIMDTKYFKVKIGFGSDDFISIDETELKTAIKAQITGQIAIFKEGTIAGNNIISITPNWNKVMGFNRDYQLTGEDYKYIGNERVNEYRNCLENTTNEIKGLPPRRDNLTLGEGSKKLAKKMSLN